MEIDEKSLLTPQEATLLKDLMKTAINHQERILEEKLKHIRQSIKEEPGFAVVELLCKMGDVDTEKQISDFLDKKKVDLRKRSAEIAELCSSILEKLPSLVK